MKSEQLDLDLGDQEDSASKPAPVEDAKPVVPPKPIETLPPVVAEREPEDPYADINPQGQRDRYTKKKNRRVD